MLFLFQYLYQLSERQKEQLIWSHFVNTQGREGANIPADLHMEHLNRWLKTVLRNVLQVLRHEDVLLLLHKDIIRHLSLHVIC